MAEGKKQRLLNALREFEAAMSDIYGPRRDTKEASEVVPSPEAMAIAVQCEIMVHVGGNSMTLNKARVFQLELDRAAAK